MFAYRTETARAHQVSPGRTSARARSCAAGLILVLSWGGAHRLARAESDMVLSLEAPGALALDTPQEDRFGLGGLPAATLYMPVATKFMVGARLRAGLLADGDPPPNPMIEDPGIGGYVGLGATARFQPLARRGERRTRGLWLEGGAGAALTGDLVRPAAEAGLGWGFPVGGVTIAPFARYLHVFQPADALDGRDAQLALVGAEFTFGDRDDRMPGFGGGLDSDRDGIPDQEDRCASEPEDTDDYQDEDGCPDTDNDGDRIADADDRCPDEKEVINGIDDQDGCPDKGVIHLIEDRVVLEERVLFEFGRSDVRLEARPMLQAIVTLWNQHPEWQVLSIEGHADVRGTLEYNQRLSEDRARKVRRVLIELGVPPEKVTATGFGKSRPLDRRDSEEAHQRNRRVEFVMVSKRKEREVLDVGRD
jgi:outer membrane protein OmpA-like peptidoglycan-associated protein